MSHVCPKCGDVFVRPGMLAKHCCEYPCTFCPKTFPRKWNRECHEKTCLVKKAMGMSDIKHILLEVQQKVRNLEHKHKTVVTRYNKTLSRQESKYTALWEKVNQQAWQISELMNRPAPRPAPRPVPQDHVDSLLDRVDKRLGLGKHKKKPKQICWDRVDTDLLPFPFTGDEINYEWMHRAITKQKHDAWKLMVEQLLEDDMGFSLQGRGNILGKGDHVYDAWKSVDRWFWCITHRFEPRVIKKKEEFGQEKNTYILDGIETVAWNGIKYRYDWHDHRAMLIGEALAHLVETDKDDKEYMQPDESDDEVSTLIEIAKDLIAVANETPPVTVEERKVEETDVIVL